MPWKVVNAIEQAPYRCVCGAGVAPFVETDVAHPGGGVYSLCVGRCARQLAQAVGMVTLADFEGLRAQLATASEQVAVLDAARERIGVLEAELANRDAELSLERAEKSATTTALASAQRDIHDLKYEQFPSSEVPAALDEFREDVVVAVDEMAASELRTAADEMVVAEAANASAPAARRAKAKA